MFDKFKKEKTYSFDKFGYAQMIYDIRRNKIDKIANGTTWAIMIGLVGIGLLSKEFFAVYAVGRGIDFVADLVIK